MSTVAPSDQRPSTEEQPDSHSAADTVGEVVRQVKPKLRGWLHAGMAPLAHGRRHRAGLPWRPTELADRRRDLSWPPRCCCSAPARSTTASTGVPRARPSCAGWTTRTSTCSSPRRYTPIALLMLTGSRATTLLTIIWSAALAGLLFRLFWLSAPRWLYTALYLAMGWAALVWLPRRQRRGRRVHLDHGRRAALQRRRHRLRAASGPDPSPRWFGFHEIFHACTIAGLRGPLHRDLAGHVRQLMLPPSARSAAVRAGPPAPPASVTGSRQTNRRQTYAVGRPSRSGRSASSGTPGVSGEPDHDHRAGRSESVRGPGQLARSPASVGSPATATCTGGRTQPAGRRRPAASRRSGAPGPTSAAGGRGGPVGALDQLRTPGQPPPAGPARAPSLLRPGGGRVVGRDPAGRGYRLSASAAVSKKPSPSANSVGDHPRRAARPAPTSPPSASARRQRDRRPWVIAA